MLLQLPFSYFLSFLNLILGLTQCDKAIELTRANIKHIINIYNILFSLFLHAMRCICGIDTKPTLT